jgi:hypothetical protein
MSLSKGTEQDSVIEKSGGGVTATFISLSDTPSSYVGHAFGFLKINGSADGIEFTDGAGIGEELMLLDLADTPSSLFNKQNFLFAVNSSSTGFTLVDNVSFLENIVKIVNLPEHDSDLEAGSAGLATDQIYKTTTGELRIKL